MQCHGSYEQKIVDQILIIKIFGAWKSQTYTEVGAVSSKSFRTHTAEN